MEETVVEVVTVMVKHAVAEPVAAVPLMVIKAKVEKVIGNDGSSAHKDTGHRHEHSGRGWVRRSV